MTLTTRVLFVFLLLSPAAVPAQTPPAPSPLVVERVHTPFVVAPDYKVTDINGELGQLAGGYIGRVIDDALFIGGAGYWLVNGSRGEELAYGGLVVGWSMPQWAGIRFGARGLVGAGSGTLRRDITVVRGIRDRTIRFGEAATGPQSSTVRVLARDDFFVFEPQVNAVAKLLPHVAVNVAGGYRLTGFTNALDGRLNGATGNLALQLDW